MKRIINEATKLTSGWIAFPSSVKNGLLIYGCEEFYMLALFKKDGTYTIKSNIEIPELVHEALLKLGERYLKILRLSSME